MLGTTYERTCECGREFTAGSSNGRYCVACSEARKTANLAAWTEAKKAKQTPAKSKPVDRWTTRRVPYVREECYFKLMVAIVKNCPGDEDCDTCIFDTTCAGRRRSEACV